MEFGALISSIPIIGWFWVRVVMRFFRTRKGHWPLRPVIQEYRTRWDRHTGMAIFLDVVYVLEPAITPTIVQAVNLQYGGDWFDGDRSTPAETMMSTGSFPIGETIVATSAPYTSRFMLVVPDDASEVTVTPVLIVMAGGKPCKARTEAVTIHKK